MSTVLLVQPDPELNDGWCLALEASGHTVLATEGTAQGLDRLREGAVDVIVVEAGEDQRKVGEFVTELHRLPDPPPFILVSSSPGAPEMSARLGAAAFLPMPCSVGELDRLVGRLSATPITPMLEDEPTIPRMRHDRVRDDAPGRGPTERCPPR